MKITNNPLNPSVILLYQNLEILNMQKRGNFGKDFEYLFVQKTVI